MRRGGRESPVRGENGNRGEVEGKRGDWGEEWTQKKTSGVGDLF